MVDSDEVYAIVTGAGDERFVISVRQRRSDGAKVQVTGPAGAGYGVAIYDTLGVAPGG